MTAPPDDFDVLMDRIRHGDENALAELVDRHAHILRREARRRLGPVLWPLLDSMDLVQSVQRVLLIGFRRRKFQFTCREELIALAMTLIGRRIARHWRYLRKQCPNGAEPLDDDQRAEALLALLSPRADPARAAEARDEVRHILRLLTETDRLYLELRLLGYGTAEAAERLGVTPVAIRTRLGRLRQRLQENGYDDAWLWAGFSGGSHRL